MAIISTLYLSPALCSTYFRSSYFRSTYVRSTYVRSTYSVLATSVLAKGAFPPSDLSIEFTDALYATDTLTECKCDAV
jgi:hypothetical protein